MMRTQGRLLLFGVLLIVAGRTPIGAQETRTMKPGAQSPPARLEDLAWLQGVWEGPGIAGPATEVYSGPAGGQIVGHFRQLRDGGIWFYEIMTIAQVGASLEYRLKHFNQDLTGWEEKGQVVKFPLVAVEKDAWYFDGLTVRRDGPDGMIGAVRIDSTDGPPREAVFKYRRVRSTASRSVPGFKRTTGDQTGRGDVSACATGRARLPFAARTMWNAEHAGR